MESKATVRVNLPAAGREASFVKGLCQSCENPYPLTLNHTGFVTVTYSRLSIFIVQWVTNLHEELRNL